MHSGRFGFTADAADTVPGSVQTGSLCSVGAAKLAVREFGRVGLQLAALFATPQQNVIAAAAAEPTSCLRWYSWRESFMALAGLSRCGRC